MLLPRFNSGTLPAGELLPAGIEPDHRAHRARIRRSGRCDFLDTELLLPFHRTPEDSLAFDRGAGPVSTWPIVDYFQDLQEHRVYRTFDGWCRLRRRVTSPDFGEEFTLDTYLRSGERHASIEPDVATAHATVAHALKRSGRPEDALASYLRAARCVPPLPWCDWEALKIAALLRDDGAAFEAADRLCSRAPKARWKQRETTPGRVAEVLAPIAFRMADGGPWLRLVHQLEGQAEGGDKAIVSAIVQALEAGEDPPSPRPPRKESVLPGGADIDAWWAEAKRAYADGELRDDDLLLDPALIRLGRVRPVDELLHIRREF
ncbi:MAG: hypothetical protein R3B99_33690 [Polyangiales bacterium]